jgi:type IV pilus assembly protein PilA
MHDIINRLRNKKRDEGFTLIELLVVVVIIGVLVAIAVPVYLNYRKGAADKSAQSDLRGAVSAIEQYYTDNGNVYPANIALTSTSPVTLTAQTNGTAGTITLSSGTNFQYAKDATTGATFIACTYNSDGNGLKKIYVYNSSTGGSVKASIQTTIAACITNGT